MNTIAQALRYLADHDRPIGGQERFNAEHLHWLAKDAESAIAVWAKTEKELCAANHGKALLLAQKEAELRDFRQAVADALAALRAEWESLEKQYTFAYGKSAAAREIALRIADLDATIAALGLTAMENYDK